jgi:hypothetical protein
VSGWIAAAVLRPPTAEEPTAAEAAGCTPPPAVGGGGWGEGGRLGWLVIFFALLQALLQALRARVLRYKKCHDCNDRQNLLCFKTVAECVLIMFVLPFALVVYVIIHAHI